MNKTSPTRSVIIIIVALLVGASILLWSDATSARPLAFQQTWPSRTPTPSGGPTDSPPGSEPTSEPGGGTDEPGDGGSATAVAGSTPVAAIPTPIGGYLPTAEACGSEPTAQALGWVNVREGPGLDFDVLTVMVYLEVRPVVGRAADATWWMIELPDGTYGWVFDLAVILSGYTGNVAIIPSPPIDGMTPTPGIPWEPTPNPLCTPLPTALATASAEPSNTPTAGATSIEIVTETASPEAPTATPPPPTTEVPTIVPSDTPEPTAPPERSTAAPAPTIASAGLEEAASNIEDGTSPVSFLLIGGLGLIIAGMIAAVVLRRNTAGSD